MHILVRKIFYRLQTLDPVEEEKRLIVNVETPAEGEVRMNMQSIHDISQVAAPPQGVAEVEPAKDEMVEVTEKEPTEGPEAEVPDIQTEGGPQRADCKLFLSKSIAPRLRMAI